MKRVSLSVVYLICQILCLAQTIENPVFDRTDVPSFHVDKIEITKDTTFVYCTYYAEENSWANISPETYLEDVETGKKYTILGSEGLPFGPAKRDFIFAERIQAKLSFPSMRTATSLNFIEKAKEKAFNVYGIDLNLSYNNKYNVSDYRRFRNMSEFYEISNDTLNEIGYRRNELEACKYVYGIKSEPFLLSLLNLSITLDKYGYYQEALEKMIKVDELHKLLWGETDVNYAQQLRTLAQFYSHNKNYDLSIKTYKKSINLYQSLNICDNQYALALSFLADDYYEIGDNVNALLCQKKSIEIRREIGDVNGYINELTIVLYSGSEKNIMDRILLVENELENLPNFVVGQSIPIADIQKQIASMYSLINDNKKAIDYCEKAIEIYEKNGLQNGEEYANILAFKAIYGLKDKRINHSLETGWATIQLYDSMGIQSKTYAELLCQMANSYVELNDYEKSVLLLDKACTIYESLHEWLLLADALGHIGNAYQNMREFDYARRYVNKALEILNNPNKLEEIGIDGISVKDERVIVIKNGMIQTIRDNLNETLMRIYEKNNNIQDAIQIEIERGKNAKEMNDNEIYCSHLINMAYYYQKVGKYSDAYKCLRECINIASKNSYLPFAYFLLSKILFENGDTNQALEYIKKGIKSSDSLENFRMKVLCQFFLSYVYFSEKQYDIGEKYWSDVIDDLKTKIISDIIGSTSQQKQRFWGEYENYFQLYRSLVTLGDNDAEKFSNLYDNVLFSKSLLLDSDIEDKYRSNRMNVKWTDIQKNLGCEDVAVEFINAMDSSKNTVYYALIVDKLCQTPQLVPLFSDAKLDSVFAHAKNPRDLGDFIWKPIISRYKEKKNIFFSPDGVLHKFSFEYLPVDTIQCLFDSYNMYRLTSTKEILKKNKQSRYNNAVLYGGLDYDVADNQNNTFRDQKVNYKTLRRAMSRGTIEPLENTLDEVCQIQKLLKNNKIETKLYTDVQGTEESFRGLSGKHINVLHMATHGIYYPVEEVKEKDVLNTYNFIELMDDNNPVKEDAALTHCFLAMSGCNRLLRHDTLPAGICDGFLTAKEISQTNLKDLELVVLASCSSAEGDLSSDGIYGLQRGFKKAGVNSILMSLGNVDDEATKILMVEFYRNLMAGKPKLQSFKLALKYLQEYENGKYSHPNYWMSFIMLDGLN